jgi:hypothetical protein
MIAGASAVLDQLLEQRQRMLDDIEAGNASLCKQCALADIDDAIFFYKAAKRGVQLDADVAGNA